MYTFLENWLKASEWEETLRHPTLGAEATALLLGEGSLTLELERVFNTPVEVEVSRTAHSPLEADEAEYLEETPAQESMEREVCLKAGGKRLVYARTVIPLALVEKDLIDVLKEGDEPIGKILSDKNYHFAKDRLELGLVRSESAAAALGVDPGSPLFARRYRLLSRKEGNGWNIKASVTEVFSPELMHANG